MGLRPTNGHESWSRERTGFLLWRERTSRCGRAGRRTKKRSRGGQLTVLVNSPSDKATTKPLKTIQGIDDKKKQESR